MKQEEFIPGQYYYMWYNGERSWILQLDKFEGTHLRMLQGISPTSKQKGSPGGWGSFDSIKQARPATTEEINHLNACVKAGKYIEPVESKIYQIY